LDAEQAGHVAEADASFAMARRLAAECQELFGVEIGVDQMVKARRPE